MAAPSGVGNSEVLASLAEIRAIGDINNVPAARLTDILDRAEKDLRERPDDPPPKGGPPPAPLLNP